MTDPIPQAERAYQSRLSANDRARITEHILTGWALGHSIDHSFAMAWDTGVMLAARRTWWRIGADVEDQLLRPVIPARSETRQPRPKPVLKATGPGQVWSWDITDLQTPWRGKAFKAYKIIDVFSREIKGWRVEERSRSMEHRVWCMLIPGRR